MTDQPPCSCPFSAGELMALGAIVATHSPNQALARKCYDHAHTHPVQPQEDRR